MRQASKVLLARLEILGNKGLREKKDRQEKRDRQDKLGIKVPQVRLVRNAQVLLDPLADLCAQTSLPICFSMIASSCAAIQNPWLRALFKTDPVFSAITCLLFLMVLPSLLAV